MKISKRVREEAAMICAIAASNDWHPALDWELTHGSAVVPGKDTLAENLAWAAERVAYRVWQWKADHNPNDHWAEAESLLRTGWSPEQQTPPAMAKWR